MNALLTLALWSCATAAPGETRLLNSFESPAEASALRQNQVRLESAQTGVTDGRQALRVQFLEGDWPNIRSVPSEPADWSAYGALAIDLTNPGGEPIRFGVRVDDDASADGVKHCRQGEGRIDPGQTRTFVLPLGAKADPMAFGMRGLPPVYPGGEVLRTYSYPELELKHIVAWQVFMHRPKQPSALIIDNVRLVQFEIRMDGIVDRYGQYTQADWPGKLKQDADFAARLAAEQADWKAHPAPPKLDRYGGYTGAPARQATGFFRVEKIGGQWWLVTPEGHIFFSAGMDCVTAWNGTVVTGRENMFTWLPGENDPLARHVSQQGNFIRGPVKAGRVLDFYACNLERKFGRDYRQPWFDEAIDRLHSWGFNTVGNWSDAGFANNGRIAYVATVHIGGNHRRISSGEDYWGQMHDPFDPAFRSDTASAIRDLAAKIKSDPWCLGWFVDNELSWGGWGDDGGRYGLALGTLAGAPELPAKHAFIAQLRKQYGEISRLNSAWSTQFESWERLPQPYKPSGPLPAPMKTDLAAFVKDLARQYFRVVRDELQKADPNHLYLGCRFAWHTPEAVAAAAETCEVISLNVYAPRLKVESFPALKGLDKPCIIGEFHFGALDRGMFHTGLVATPNQQARAEMYRDYVRSVADQPNFIGCHWFQYVDQPLTGRSFDGENYNIGFVTITDTPYPEMVAAARAVHAEIYSRRWK